jgi:hypothetical protein
MIVHQQTWTGLTGFFRIYRIRGFGDSNPDNPVLIL